ncbi:hypothetical protein C1H46_012837 [Malus baccata]|uniref:Uncharacterized protein n=1 Tax=Malus baccata TaxID=106549 RepID=A0A540MS36_MALBA|nr:hypothetical protein C1H46_012837 [Malus baccata]
MHADKESEADLGVRPRRKDDLHATKKSHSSCNSEKYVEMCTPKVCNGNCASSVSPCSKKGEDKDGLLLPVFNELVEEFDFGAANPGFSSRKNVETPRSDVDTPKAYRSDVDEYEQEIRHLRNTVRSLRERELSLELRTMKDLEDEAEELRKSNLKLQLQNSELARSLESTQVLANSILEDPEDASTDKTGYAEDNESPTPFFNSNKSPAAYIVQEGQNNIFATSSHSSLIASLDHPRWRSLKGQDTEDVRSIQRHSDVGYHSRYKTFSREGSAEKVELVKYAEALVNSRGVTLKVHRKSASAS